MDIEQQNYPLVVYVLSNIERAVGKAEEKTINFTKVNIEHTSYPKTRRHGDYPRKTLRITLISWAI